MTATVLTFTRGWQGPARERDTWAKCRDEASLGRVVSGYYDRPRVDPTILTAIAVCVLLTTPLYALAAWWIWS
jgi:hypothetical protein